MDHPFVLFGGSHLSALAATGAGASILISIARLSNSSRAARKIRWLLAGLLIVSWGLWLLYLFENGWLSPASVLPMNLCDWATLATIITLLWPNQRSYELAYFWGLGGALALLTPDLGIDFPGVPFLIFFAVHGGVIASLLFLTLGMGMRPLPASIPRVVAWSAFYLLAAVTVNALFDTNFGYLRAKPLHSSPLDRLGPWPYYVGEMTLLSVGLIVILYAPFLIADWRRNASPGRTNENANGWTFGSFLNGMADRRQETALIAVRRGTLETMSYGELGQRIRMFAKILLEQGVKPGDTVALLARTGFAWVVARFALGAIGAVAVAIDDLATEGEVQAILSGSKAGFLLCNSSRAEALYRANPALKMIILDDLPQETRGFESPPAEWQQSLELPGPAPLMLAFTSGTTGASKAIVLTQANIAANVRALVEAHMVGAGDRVLLPLPLVHVYPFVVGLLVPLESGAAVVFPEGGTGAQILEAIHLANVSAIVGVPRLYSAISSGLLGHVRSSGFAGRALFSALLNLSVVLRKCAINAGGLLFPAARARFGSKLRLLVSGGAKLEPETLWTLLGLGFDVRSGYGLAETSAMFTGNLPGMTRWESEGKPINGCLRIAAPDGSGTGEIELKGPQVFSHYFGNEMATSGAFTADGWFKTGDLGHVDEDGFLFVSGRAGDLLVLGGGKKVDPETLERIYGGSRYIREIAVLEHKGSLAALIVPSLEASYEGGAMHIDTAIRIELASRAQALPSYQRLAGFAIVRQPLPRTRLGKYRRFLLPAIYERARSGAPRQPAGELSVEDSTLLAQPVARRVYEMLCQRYRRPALELDASPLLDLGIDSLEWISFGLELEDRLNLRLSEAEIGSVATVRDLLRLAARGSSAPVQSATASCDWTAPTGSALKLLGASIYALNHILMHSLFHLRASGREHILPGNFILIANHASYLDAPAIAAALPYRTLRRCYWAGDPAILFAKRWQTPFMRAVQCFPADERTPAHTLKLSADLLARGDSIIWFPEGWRTPDGRLQAFLPGIGNLLLRVLVPVVPAYIEGTFEALPRNRVYPRIRAIHVEFGRPIVPAQLYGMQTPQAIAEFLHRALEELKAEYASGLARTGAGAAPHH